MELKKINNSCMFLLLPVEIAADIFSRIPVDSVLQCKLVCKTWRDLIAADHVEKTVGGFLLRPQTIIYRSGFHYGEYNDDKVPCFNLTKKTMFLPENHLSLGSVNWPYIVGSCNGLICLIKKWHIFIHHHHDMYVCNPYKGEYAKLPNHPNHPILVHPSTKDYVAYGFGYHPSTKEYKVIRICGPFNSSSDSVHVQVDSMHVQVYTLGSGTSAWRSIGETRHKLYRPGILFGDDSDNNSWGVLLNGVLYWLTENRKLIISFDLEHEEFRVIPTTLPEEFIGPLVLGVLGGCLCFSSTGVDDNTRIWVMNNKDYSWDKKFSISWRKNFRPFYRLTPLESGKILFHCNCNKLVSYDPETEHIAEFNMRDRFEMIPYMKSSVSLKALGEKEAIQVTADEENKLGGG